MPAPTIEVDQEVMRRIREYIRARGAHRAAIYGNGALEITARAGEEVRDAAHNLVSRVLASVSLLVDAGKVTGPDPEALTQFYADIMRPSPTPAPLHLVTPAAAS